MTTTHARILCIDDHPASREVMKLLLIGVLGYTDARIIGCSQDALERLAHSSYEFDAILLDLNMAPLNGYDLLTQFRSHPQHRKAQIIALAAAVSPDTQLATRRAGFDGLISKPIDPTTFSSFMQRLLKRQQLWEVV